MSKIFELCGVASPSLFRHVALSRFVSSTCAKHVGYCCVFFSTAPVGVCGFFFFDCLHTDAHQHLKHTLNSNSCRYLLRVVLMPFQKPFQRPSITTTYLLNQTLCQCGCHFAQFSHRCHFKSIQDKKNEFLHAVLIRSSTYDTSPELSFSVPETTRLHPLETVTFVSISAPAHVSDTTWPHRETQAAHRNTDEESYT